MGLIVFRNFSARARSFASSTPAFVAAWNASSVYTSHPPKKRSWGSAQPPNSLIFGTRASVRFPRRIVPICVNEPTGMDSPRRTSSTPAISVVLTAPIPGVSTPNFPFGGAILPGLRIQFPPASFGKVLPPPQPSIPDVSGTRRWPPGDALGWNNGRHDARSARLLQIDPASRLRVWRSSEASAAAKVRHLTRSAGRHAVDPKDREI